MSEYLIQKDTMSFIADAVRYSSGISTKLTPNDIAREIFLLNPRSNIANDYNGVIFYDYDGTILYSYTVQEARALITLPEGPTHDGLPFAGWTHSLEEVTSVMRCLMVGAMYSPETTKLTIDLSKGMSNTINLYFNQTESNGITISWGDGTTSTVSETGDVSALHEYSETGVFIIELSVNSGKLSLGGSITLNESNIYKLFGSHDNNKILTNVVVGNNCKLDNYVFFGCTELANVVISANTVSIPFKCFASCYKLSCAIIPSSVRQLYGYAFNDCENLTTVVIPTGCSLDCGVYTGGHQFAYCTSIERIILPSSIDKMPSYLFYLCRKLKSIYLRRSTPPTFSGSPRDDTFKDIAQYSVYAIYVPINSLDKYKTADGWSTIEFHITGEPPHMT